MAMMVNLGVQPQYVLTKCYFLGVTELSVSHESDHEHSNDPSYIHVAQVPICVPPAQEEGFPCILPLLRYCCSVPKLGLTLCDPMDCSIPGFPSFTVSRNLPKFMSTESVMLSNHLILCCPLLLLPSIFPSTRVFCNKLPLPIRWPKYWSFSFSINSFNEYSWFTSFRIGWFDLLVEEGTL